MSDDLHRYLRGEPVMAAPDSLFYRWRKLVGRHRWVTATCLGGVILNSSIIPMP